MAFDSHYKTVIQESEWKGLVGNIKPCETILPFFGFMMHVDRQTESHLDTYGGNIWVSERSPGNYEVTQSEKRLYTRTRTTYYKEWRRGSSPIHDSDLEGRVQQWMKKKNIKDVWTTPYIAPTVEDFHKNHGYGPLSALLGWVALATILIGAIGTIALLLIGNYVATLLPDGLQFLINEIAIAPLSATFFIMVITLIIRGIHNSKHRQLPLSQRKKKYRDKMRAQYYKGLYRTFGKELGAEMQAFSEWRETGHR